jgi:hypothetical protein
MSIAWWHRFPAPTGTSQVTALVGAAGGTAGTGGGATGAAGGRVTAIGAAASQEPIVRTFAVR